MVVEINLVGAVVPILLSALFFLVFRKKIQWRRVVVFIATSFAIITTISSIVGAIYGTISLLGVVYIIFWVFIVLWYSKTKFVRNQVLMRAGELYAIGTLGVFLEDVIRTLLGLINVPIVGLRINPNIWGGAGPMDGIFMTGLYQMLIYLVLAINVVRRQPTAKEVLQESSNRQSQTTH